MLKTQSKTETNNFYITDKGCRALASAVILDAIREYANALVRLKRQDFSYQSEACVERDIYDCEWFFKSDLFLLYAGGVDLNISGREILKMINKDPSRYARRLKERSWHDSQRR